MNHREVASVGGGIVVILCFTALFISLAFSDISEEKEVLMLEAVVLKLEIEKLKKEGASK